MSKICVFFKPSCKKIFGGRNTPEIAKFLMTNSSTIDKIYIMSQLISTISPQSGTAKRAVRIPNYPKGY